MSAILSLLALLVGATAVSAFGTRMSLYLYRQGVLEVDPRTARTAQLSLSEAHVPLENSAPGHKAPSMSASTRYARIGLGVVACIVLLAILVIAGLLNSMVL